MNLEISLALCPNRHDIKEAVDGNVFAEIISDITDTKALEEVAFQSISQKATQKCKESGIHYDKVVLNLYVTGLTVALIAALNVCRREDISVVLWHYNRETDSYFPQQVD